MYKLTVSLYINKIDVLILIKECYITLFSIGLGIDKYTISIPNTFNNTNKTNINTKSNIGD